MSKKIKNEAVFAAIFPIAPDRAQRRKMQIVEGAIQGYVEVGVDQTTFEVIAKNCGISRPLITRYFENKQAIYELAILYIRANLQALAIAALQEEETPEGRLDAYVESVFEWAKKWADHAKVWLLFYYFASLRDWDRKVHSELAEMGRKRIVALLEDGKRTGIFRCANTSSAAKSIQMALTGGLVTYLSEDGPVSRKELVKLTVENCRELAKGEARE